MDLHLNMWIEDAEITTEEKKTRLGTLLVRGDNIIYVFPVGGFGAFNILGNIIASSNIFSSIFHPL